MKNLNFPQGRLRLLAQGQRALQAMGIYPLALPDTLRGYEATLDLD